MPATNPRSALRVRLTEIPHRYTYLFGALLLFLGLSSILNAMHGPRWPLLVLFYLIVVTSIRAVSHARKRYMTVISVLGTMAVLFEVVAAVLGIDWFATLADVMTVPFLLAVLWRMGWNLLTARHVTFDTILGAVSAYLLIGLVWAFLYVGIDTVFPGSFSTTIGTVDPIALGRARADLFYFSFITMTTVGYGDITPVLNVARMFAIFEGVVGQMYPAIMVARLVALHVAGVPDD